MKRFASACTSAVLVASCQVMPAEPEVVDLQASATRQAAVQLEVSPTAVTLVVGATARLDATAYDLRGRKIAKPAVAWTSLEPAVVTVDPTGRVRAEGAGTGRVVATSGAVADTARVEVVLPAPPPEEPPPAGHENPCAAYPAVRTVAVASATQLVSALADARPGPTCTARSCCPP